jgi:hypothetical protein
LGGLNLGLESNTASSEIEVVTLFKEGVSKGVGHVLGAQRHLLHLDWSGVRTKHKKHSVLPEAGSHGLLEICGRGLKKSDHSILFSVVGQSSAFVKATAVNLGEPLEITSIFESEDSCIVHTRGDGVG